MTPIFVDPSWYEHYWLRERPEPRRQTLLRGVITTARQAARLVRSIRPARSPTGATLRPI